MESSKIISEVKYKVQHSDLGSAKIDRIYGRFEDLKTGLSDKNFNQNKIDLTCEQLMHDQENKIYYSREKNDQRNFYFIYESDKLMYKGTEDLKQIKQINLNSDTKYILLYNKERENDENYEVSYNYYDPNGLLIYSFHQRANEFDEFTYEYNRSLEYHTIYKNGAIWKEYSNHDKDEIIESTVIEYIIPESYQLDKKSRPFLKESKFTLKDKNCHCREGYVTKVEFWTKNKCHEEYILE
ncbi:hypothetical protein [Chryseobacterium arachidis]|uniref:hypothetical protein n=1 Tax=Chryseobacterium arachidis TaxID=1416778 RepID=UPI0011608C49|nr:hypothetical protein [Chryseobacterium arachidis]